MSALPWKRTWLGHRWMAVAAAAVALTVMGGAQAASAASSSNGCIVSVRAAGIVCAGGDPVQTQGVRWQ